MTGVTVVLCPALDPGAPDGLRRELAGVLAGWGIPVVIPHRQPRDGAELTDERLGIAAWVADQAVAITAAQVEGPLILVSSGDANRAVPALGYSQRASRRGVVAYVLVDAPLPDPSRAGTDWPDAPVIHVTSPGRRQRSRGVRPAAGLVHRGGGTHRCRHPHRPGLARLDALTGWGRLCP